LLFRAVAVEANRVYRKWLARHSNFEQIGGKVHVIGHSLGSALVADILSNQSTIVPPLSTLPKQVRAPSLYVSTLNSRCQLVKLSCFLPYGLHGRTGYLRIQRSIHLQHLGLLPGRVASGSLSPSRSSSDHSSKSASSPLIRIPYFRELTLQVRFFSGSKTDTRRSSGRSS
jgi:hypothetical protein